MPIIGQALQSIAGIASLVCFILVIVQMFKHDKTGMGIACIVLFFCCGIGGLITFIYGWVKSREWQITNIMIVWTICVIITAIGSALSPPDLTALQHQLGH